LVRAVWSADKSIPCLRAIAACVDLQVNNGRNALFRCAGCLQDLRHENTIAPHGEVPGLLLVMSILIGFRFFETDLPERRH
jgi:hypothetical protein